MKNTEKKVIQLLVIFTLLFLTGCSLSNNSIDENKNEEDSKAIKNLYLNNVDYEELPSQEDE